jgi:hypothetical protein
MTWRASWQDYRGWPHWHNQPHPLVWTEDYDTKEEAEAEAAAQRKKGMTACVSPTPVTRGGRQPKRGPKFNSDWKLHA